MYARGLVGFLPIAAVAACATFGTPAQQAGGAALQTELSAPAAPGASAAVATPVAARPPIRISLTPVGRGLWTVRAGVSGASRVEVAGDFSDWDPVPLASLGDDNWMAKLHLAAGLHQIAMRVDGGAWVAPAGLATVTDEFGGVAGVLIVPDSGDREARRGSPPGEARQ